MPRHPERLPSALSERLAGGSAAIYSRLGREVDLAVGGIPFMLATSQELPQSIESIPIRKEQFDTEADPGEQSLIGWWRRSQASFHEGAGLLYQEASETNTPSNGFYDSSGMDVFTQQGKMSLLNAMTFNAAQATGASQVSSSGCMVYSGDLVVAGSGTTPTVIHNPAAQTVIDGWVSATNFWDITTAGNLFAGLISSPGTATTWPLGVTLSANARIMWAKDRVWIIDANKIWQPDLTLAGGTTQNPIYTSPSTSFTYTSMAPSPGPVLFAGDDGTTGVIQSITLDTDGALPTLSGATVIAEFPPWERALTIAVLAGQYVGIGSSQGFRVGRLNNDSLVYGSLLRIGTNCKAIALEDRYFLATFASDPGVVFRIDTGTEVTDGVFAYAKDVATTSALAFTSLSGSVNGTLRGTTSDGTYWYESTRLLTGWLQTGRIRFRTTEKKAFKYLNIESPPLEGNISVEAITSEGATFPLGTFTVQGVVPDEPLSLVEVPPCRFVSLKFTLAGAVDEDVQINSYTLRALPAVAPQRLITLPLLCFDRETARSGQRYGGDGYAQDRLEALRELERFGETLTYQDFSRTDNTGVPVVIESIRYVQTSPSTPSASDRTGGILVLQLRTVEP